MSLRSAGIPAHGGAGLLPTPARVQQRQPHATCLGLGFRVHSQAHHSAELGEETYEATEP